MFEITRLLPFRQYDENDVINGFALDAKTGEAGSLVKVKDANLSADPVDYTTRGDDSSWTNSMGYATSKYPTVTRTVTKVEGTGEAALGILLRDVRDVDENGENLLYYKQKADELQCVVSGQSNPVATKGLFMFNVNGLAGGAAPAIGSLAVPSANGTLAGEPAASASAEAKESAVGTWIGTGLRESQQTADAFAGAYALLKLNL